MGRKRKEPEMVVKTSEVPAEQIVSETLTEEQSVNYDEYADLKEDFHKIIASGLECFQEQSYGRHIEHVVLRLHGRYGYIVETNERGLITVTELSSKEMDNQGKTRQQRMFMGLNCSVSTKGTAFKAVNMMRQGETFIKRFEANAAAHELLQKTLEKAQQKGEEIQKQIDEEEFEYHSLYNDSNELKYDSVSFCDPGEVTDFNYIFGLITLVRQTLKECLGSKLSECKIMMFSIIDSMELAESSGKKLDSLVPRTGLIVVAKTAKGAQVFDALRSVGGLDSLKRFGTKDQTLEDLIKTFTYRLARYANDMDRAQPCSVVGSEAYILMSGQVAGVLAHECYGHVSESDIIVANKRDNEVDLNLKSRIGGLVSENKTLSIIDDGHSVVELGSKMVSGCYGAIYFDEEGIEAKRTTLVEKGTQKLAMTSALTLNEIIEGLPEDIRQGFIDHGLSGNVRSERYDRPPLVRMTNTFIVPNHKGLATKEKMAEKVPARKTGIYLETCGGGWVDCNTGDFEVTGELGYLIENGAITDKPVKDVIVRGNIMKFGSKIEQIGNEDTLMFSTGWCGKSSQWVPVEHGAPALLIKDADIGEEKPDWFWTNLYKEYKNQHLQVAQGKRDKGELYFKILDETSNVSEHSNVCLVTKCVPMEDEKELLMGTRERLASYNMKENGELEEIK